MSVYQGVYTVIISYFLNYALVVVEVNGLVLFENQSLKLNCICASGVGMAPPFLCTNLHVSGDAGSWERKIRKTCHRHSVDIQS